MLYFTHVKRPTLLPTDDTASKHILKQFDHNNIDVESSWGKLTGNNGASLTPPCNYARPSGLPYKLILMMTS